MVKPIPSATGLLFDSKPKKFAVQVSQTVKNLKKSIARVRKTICNPTTEFREDLPMKLDRFENFFKPP
jgi:hypothetical protein